MRLSVIAVVLAVGLAVSARAEEAAVRLMTLDPGHFHAALIQKEMYPGVDETVHVYAPLGADLLLHLGRVAAFNGRPDDPTRWRLEVHAGPDASTRMLREKPGNVVVLSGRNRTKIDDILASVEAGLNVLADKPWIVEAADFPKLERALSVAAAKRLVAYDVMTERHEVTTIVQRELMHDPAVVGTVGPGSAAAPAVEMESVHQLLKVVAGAVNLRPAWFFDTREQGEALADVATHLADLVQWMLYPDQAIDYRADLRVLSARRWPTALERTQLLRLTGERQLDPSLVSLMQGDRLDYFANGEVAYTLRGMHVHLRALWNYEAPAGGGDTHRAVVRGSRARLEILQGPEQTWRPELYVVPLAAAQAGAVRTALERRILALSAGWPGLSVQDEGGRLRVVIPDRHRVGHEAHFGEVTRQFLHSLRQPGTLPAWEKPNMLAKYDVTTR
ncbi:MAG TPA: putative oxidoreductase C-terminal domain-containing protein, partial [Vicinamibacteria bacterium]|nr:putative oxidoreductase C-terminal domain-containing protein [Vicinamibacteria bacterium]